MATFSKTSSPKKAPSESSGSARIIRRSNDGYGAVRGANFLDRARGWVWTGATLLIFLAGGANNTYPLPRGFAEALAAILLGAVIASPHSRLRYLLRSDWLVIALFALILLQFVPLPPWLWSALPGREAIAAIDMSVFGELTWRPITLDVEQSWSSLLFLIPAATYYIAIRTGDRARISAILLGVVAALAIGAAMAFVQILGQAWAYPFADGRADNAFAIGFFTNHNHQATFLLMGLMAFGGWLALRRQARSDRHEWISLGTSDLVLLAISILVTLCVLLTGSRAGLLLMAITLPAAACAWLAPQMAGSRKLLWPVLGVIAIGAAAFVAIPFLSEGQLSIVGERAALADDRRFDVWPQSAITAWQMMPTGSGFGTFRPAYEMFEPLGSVGMLYVNHAHNDYLEIAIEGGIPALLLLTAFLIALVRYGWLAWMTLDGRDALLARLGTVMLVTVLLHSLVDYPARTVAVSVLAAIAFSLLVRNTADIPGRTAL